MMSRPGQLPPRCPIQKSSPEKSTIEDHPAWLDELLGEKTEGNLMRVPLRRSASDSVVLVGDLIGDLSGFSIEDDENLTTEACGELGSACVYGPNSPRTRNNSTFSNNTIASAFSGFDSHTFHQNLDDNVGGVCFPNSAENASGQIGVPNTESKMAKRNPGQRSRVRKLQYIAELERTVAMLQTVEANLSVRVASLLQKRAVLSLENSHMKQQLAILKQDKLVKEGEYQSLRKEAQRLKLGFGNLPSNKKLYRSVSGPKIVPKGPPSQMDWNSLDMTKLNLN